MPGGTAGPPPPARPADDADAGGGRADGGRLLLVLVVERVLRGRAGPVGLGRGVDFVRSGANRVGGAEQ